MDDPNEENIDSNWVIINPIELAEEATVLEYDSCICEDVYRADTLEYDMESDGISIISESSHLHDGSNEDENFSNHESGDDEVTTANDDAHSESAEMGKTNWTYVHSDINPPEMATSNQFYLNCLQEPVQELSEHELGSIQSDLDSDGISIISDCDSLNEFTEDDKKLVQEDVLKENCEDADLALASKLPSGIKKYCNGVLIGTILLATSSIFLGHYFNSVEQSEEDLPIYKEEFTNDLKENVPDINDFKDKYEVPSALAYCQERHKGDDVFVEHNIKKCLNKIERRIRRKKERVSREEEMSKLNKYLKIKEQYLQEKEKFLIKREYELIKAEMKLKIKKLKRNKEPKNEEPELHTNLDDSFNDMNDKLSIGLGNVGKNEDLLSEFKKEPVINVIKKKKYKEAQRKDAGFKSKYEKFTKNRKENKQRNIHKYHKEQKENKRKYEEQNFNYKFKKYERKYMRKRGIIEEVAKKSNEFVRDSKNLQFDDNKENKHEKQKYKRNKGNTNYIVLENKNGNETVNGYWLGRLYKGRSDLRNKRHNGDWYFDRASYRKTKRDKAKWYFDWMMDRELLRHRRSFYM